jgi:hypothetical protein
LFFASLKGEFIETQGSDGGMIRQL